MSSIIFAANNTFNATFSNINNNCSNFNFINNHQLNTFSAITTTKTTTTTNFIFNNIISSINISDIINCSNAAKVDAENKPDKPKPDCCCQPQPNINEQIQGKF